MKKILNLVLVIALLLVQIIPVNALTGTNNNGGSITINNTIEGKEYKIYQILILESFDTEKGAYTYKVDPTGSWYNFINSIEIKDIYVTLDEGTNIVTWIEGASEAEFAKKALEYVDKNGISPIASATAAAGQTSIIFGGEDPNGLNLGYYLVDSSLGALCSLTTTKPSATVNEKNDIPTVEKKVKENNSGTYGDTNTDYIGKTIYYKTTIDVKAGAENYVLHDVLSSGLTLNQDSIVVKLNGQKVEATVEITEEETKTNYTVTYKKSNNVVNGFAITFDDSFTYPFTDIDELIVEYTAVLNENAVLGGEGNLNETWLNYGSDFETNHDETITYTFSFELVKTDSTDKVLPGAKFRLYDKSTDGNEITVVWDSVKNAYRTTYNTETGVDIEVGNATIIGLDNGTYYLEEVKAPEGYNKLTSRVAVVIENANLDATIIDNYWTEGGVQVVNLTGTELPDTGGMGTLLFITIGSIMVLVFGVLLVTKLRISKEA